MAKMLDLIERWLRGEAPPPPVARLVGFTLVSANPGEAVVELQTGPQHRNPMGTVHGGILGDIADAAMGIAYVTALDEDESFTTLEMKINFLKPVWDTRLRAAGRVLKHGRTIGLAACEVTDAGGSLVAYATSTCMTLRGDMARGR